MKRTTARLIGTDDPEWGALRKDARHDVFDGPAYVKLAAWHEAGEAIAVYVEQDGSRPLIPLVLRNLEHGLRDASSPYGYPGILTDRPDDARFVRSAVDMAVAALRRAGIVTLFVRLHPLWRVEGVEAQGKVVSQETVAIDLATPADEIWRTTRENHRRDIRRARRTGLRFAVETSPSAYAEFQEIYASTMDRLDAAPYYRFSSDYFERLPLAVENQLHLATVRSDQVLAAAGLFTVCGGIVQSFLIAAADGFAGQAPTKLLYHGVTQWAQQRGERWLHLGGGYGTDEDSLFHFKAGFSPTRLDFRTLRFIVRKDDYLTLVSERTPGANPADVSGYFPGYRSPRRSAAGEGRAASVLRQRSPVARRQRSAAEVPDSP